jgi:hypothetical protein
LGTLAGGFVLDYMTNTLSNAFKVGIWISSMDSSIIYIHVYAFPNAVFFSLLFFICWACWIFK